MTYSTFTTVSRDSCISGHRGVPPVGTSIGGQTVIALAWATGLTVLSISSTRMVIPSVLAEKLVPYSWDTVSSHGLLNIPPMCWAIARHNLVNGDNLICGL